MSVEAPATAPTVPTITPRVRAGLPVAGEPAVGSGVANVGDPVVTEPVVGVPEIGVEVGTASVLPDDVAEAGIVTVGLLAEAVPEITLDVVAGEMTLYGMGTDRYVAILETGRTEITATQSLMDCAS